MFPLLLAFLFAGSGVYNLFTGKPLAGIIGIGIGALCFVWAARRDFD